MPFCLSGTIQGLDKQFPAHLWIKSFTQVMKGRSGWNVAGELMENPIFKSFLFRIVFVCAKTFWPFSCLQKRVSSYFFSADNLLKQFLNGPSSDLLRLPTVFSNKQNTIFTTNLKNAHPVAGAGIRTYDLLSCIHSPCIETCQIC